MTESNNSEILQITDNQFESEVLKNPQPVLVDFWAPWCGPCRMITPILHQLADEFQGKLKIVKVNVDENQTVAGQFGIQAIPTLLIVKGGNVVETIVGLRSKPELAGLVTKHVS